MEGRTGHEVQQVSGIMFDGNHDSTITFAAILLFLTWRANLERVLSNFFP